MATPTLFIALAVLPGLGLLALGKYKAAFLYAIIPVYGALIAASLLSSGIWRTLALGVALAYWYFQARYTYQVAQRDWKSAQGEPVPVVRDVKLPANLSASENIMFKVQEQLKHQLAPNETLQAAVAAVKAPMVTIFYQRNYFIGLTEKDMILLELDFLSEPLYITRYPLAALQDTALKSSKYKKELTLRLPGDTEPTKFTITKLFQMEQVYAFEDILFGGDG